MFYYISNQNYSLFRDDSGYFYLYRLSYMWYVVIGFFVTIIVGLVVSFVYSKIRPGHQKRVGANLFSPWVRRILPREIKEVSGFIMPEFETECVAQFKEVSSNGSLEAEIHRNGGAESSTSF
jgi:hypothetical protein